MISTGFPLDRPIKAQNWEENRIRIHNSEADLVIKHSPILNYFD